MRDRGPAALAWSGRRRRTAADEVTGPERTRGRRKRNMQVGALWAIGVMS